MTLDEIIALHNNQPWEVERIFLGKGKFVLIDKENAILLKQYRWTYHKNGYAVSYIRDGKTLKLLRMHRLINQTPKDLFTDHINRNKLDNRKCNLRTVTKSQNEMNKDLRKTGTSSGYRGVYLQGKKFRVKIQIQDKQIHIGYFSDLQLALLARKKAEEQYYDI